MTTWSVAKPPLLDHNSRMTKATQTVAAKMANDGLRLRRVREEVGAARFARAAHIALTTHKTFDEALAEVDAAAYPLSRRPGTPPPLPRVVKR